MFDIQLNLGNVPSVLTRLGSPAIAQHCANAAAESYHDDILEWIRAGRAFRSSPQAQLEGSMDWHGNGNGSATVYCNADGGNPDPKKRYGAYVELGTPPHVILPRSDRGALKIPVSTGGGFILRRKVNHPGSRLFPFFFADTETRNRHMQERAMSVLASYANE